MEPIMIRMLGEFSIAAGDIQISDANNRSRKVWGLLAYLICNRDHSAPQKKLIDLLWGDDPSSSNPDNALRITLHRLRGVLDQLWPNAGRDLIQNREGGYRWNPEVPVRLDYEEFEQLATRTYPDEDARLAGHLEALALYGGEFLPKQSGELWIIPISTHFQNLYLQLTTEASTLLLDRNRGAEAAELCRRAVAGEPYHEGLHQLLIRSLAAKGDQKGAADAYESLQNRLFDDFGIRPSAETRDVYRAAVYTLKDRTVPVDELLEELHEEDVSGALVCDYDYFKMLCFAESRSMERSGVVNHVALINLVSLTGAPLSKKSQERYMEQLELLLRQNLRRGDTIARCSVSQYTVLLRKANYENSCMVCRRLVAAFNHAGGHSGVKLNFMVLPLTPSFGL